MRIVKILPTVQVWHGQAQSPFIAEWKLDPLKTRMHDQMKVENKSGKKYMFDFGGGAERS